MEQTDFSLASTEELVAELARRYDHYIFLGHQKREAALDAMFFQFGHNPFGVLGLMQWAEDNIRASFHRPAGPTPEL